MLREVLMMDQVSDSFATELLACVPETLRVGYNGSEGGLACIAEFFREVDRRLISNTSSMAQYYSRFHLQLDEETIFAATQVNLTSGVLAR